MSQILRSIGVIARSLAAISNVEFREIQLDKDQYLYITRIYENPGIINDTLAEMVSQERTTVSKSVKKLMERGLIYKEVDHENKKIRRLYLTVAGIEMYDFLRREELLSEKQALAGISLEEQETLLQLLQHMQYNVEAELKSIKNGKKRMY